MTVLVEEIVTGERLQALCDLTITCKHVDAYHTSLPSTIKRIFLDAPDFELLKNARTIFCYTHLLNLFIALVEFFDHPFVLMTHNSDDVIDETFLPLLNSDKLIHWFAQSCTIHHHKLTSIPIGIANAQWRHGNLELISHISKQNTLKDQYLFINFNIMTNPTKRLEVATQLQDAGYWIPDPILTQVDYLNDMSRHQYVACPVGHSPDCHRFYEALYLGCTPIVDISNFYRYMNATHVGIVDHGWSLLGLGTDLSPFEYHGNPDILLMSYWTSMVKSFDLDLIL